MANTSRKHAMNGRKIASDTAIWFFDQLEDSGFDIDNFFKSAASWMPAQGPDSKLDPKLSPETWAEMLATAISAFNEGLEDYIDLDSNDIRQASKAKADYHAAVNMVGREAFSVIAFLVSAADLRRPGEAYQRASTLYTQAMSDLSNYNVLFNTTKELQELSKTPGIDPTMAQNIASMAADLQEKANAATAYGQADPNAPKAPDALPTGIQFQGRRRRTESRVNA